MNPKDAFDTFKTFPQLETRRLVLREVKPSEAKDLFRFMSDEDTVKQNLTHPHTKIAETDKLIKTLTKQYNKKRELRWGVTIRGSNTLIGLTGFYNMLPKDFQTEVGCLLDKQHWSGGIMTEALAAILAFGFEKMAFNRITAFILPDNIGAIKMVKKVGFREEGLLKECKFLNDRFYDLGIYSLLKKDYLQRPEVS
jgi:ribosomal-protein-alanine N-acetyltransferase